MKMISDVELVGLLLRLGADPEKVWQATEIAQIRASLKVQDVVLDRREALSTARTLFAKTGITKNIGHALELFQQHLADRARPAKITKRHESSLYSIIPGYLRPKCPECELELRLRLIRTPKGKANKKGWKSCWVCQACAWEEYSTRPFNEWLSELHKRYMKRKEA